MIAFFIGLILGLVVMSITISLSAVVVSLFTDSYISIARVFGKTGRRSSPDQKFTWNSDKFVLLPSFYLQLGIDEETDSKYKKVTLAMDLLLMFLNFLYAFVILYFFWKNPKFGARILRSSAEYAAIVGILTVIMRIYRTFIKGQDLASFSRSQVLKLKNGATFEQLDMSIPDGMFDKATRQEKVFYLYLCFSKALWMKNFSALNNLVRQMDLAVRKHGTNSEYAYETLIMGGYYHILFYSSYVNPNPSHAARIYNLIKPAIEADMDANGRRTLAYYQFYILNQPQLASITLNQAIEALQTPDMNRITQAELNLEKRLIEELQDNMTRILNPGTFTKPVIENTFDDAPIF